MRKRSWIESHGINRIAAEIFSFGGDPDQHLDLGYD